MSKRLPYYGAVGTSTLLTCYDTISNDSGRNTWAFLLCSIGNRRPQRQTRNCPRFPLTNFFIQDNRFWHWQRIFSRCKFKSHGTDTHKILSAGNHLPDCPPICQHRPSFYITDFKYNTSYYNYLSSFIILYLSSTSSLDGIITYVLYTPYSFFYGIEYFHYRSHKYTSSLLFFYYAL